MPAHLRPIAKRTCQTCGKPATQTLCNHYNEPINDYCNKHGALALTMMQREVARARESASREKGHEWQPR